MTIRKFLLLLFTLSCSLAGIAQNPDLQFPPDTNDSIFILACSEQGFANYLARSTDPVEVVHHTAYSLGYSEKHEQPLWVSYVLSASECTGEEERGSSFYVDPLVKTGSATNTAYVRTGYDRGHLAPAGDMAYSPVAMKESFYYSNMSPQVPAFNRGIWKLLETQVRKWGIEYQSLLVITGPLFTADTLLRIGPDKVTVPDAYFKIIVNPNVRPPEAIAFVFKNEASKRSISEYVVTIDEVEKLSGLNFFATCFSSLEDYVESHVQGSAWSGMESVKINCKE